MTVVLTTRTDIDLDCFRRVAWQGEAVRISEAALQRIARCRESLPAAHRQGPRSRHLWRDHGHGRAGEPAADPGGARAPCPASSPSPPPPPSATLCPSGWCAGSCWRGWPISSTAMRPPRRASPLPSPPCWTAGPCPGCPPRARAGRARSSPSTRSSPSLATRFDLEVKERGSLINGSPAAAALLGDAALAARRRVQLAHQVFALSIEAFRAPLEHYDAALEALWGDEHEAAALQGLRDYLLGPAAGAAITRRPSAIASSPGCWPCPSRLGPGRAGGQGVPGFGLRQSGLYPAG